MTRLLIVKAETLKERKAVEELLKKHSIISYDVYKTDGAYKFEILVNREDSVILENELQQLGFGKSFKKCILIQDVLVSVPSIKRKQVMPTISDDEIKEDIRENATLNWVYIGFVTLASLVIGLGLLTNNIIVVIGGMLIAPVLYPIIGSSYYLISWKEGKVREHLRTEVVSLVVPLLFGFLLGISVRPEVLSDLVLGRTIFSIYDVGVALFAGAAGTLSLITRKLSGFSGVAIAVAVIPPAVVAGLCLGILNLSAFLGALGATIGNVFFIHLASIILLRVLGYPK